MSVDISSSIVFQLWALKDHLTQATSPTQMAAIYASAVAAGVDIAAPSPARPVSVINREVVGFWQGSGPVVEVLFERRNVVAQTNNPRGVGSQGAAMAQSFAKPNLYDIRIRTRVDPDNNFGPDEAQTELMMVSEAIEVWFSSLTHRCLPTSGGIKRVHYAGPPFEWVANTQGLYREEDGQLGQVMAGRITVLGIPRLTTP